MLKCLSSYADASLMTTELAVEILEQVFCWQKLTIQIDYSICKSISELISIWNFGNPRNMGIGNGAEKKVKFVYGKSFTYIFIYCTNWPKVPSMVSSFWLPSHNIHKQYLLKCSNVSLAN